MWFGALRWRWKLALAVWLVIAIPAVVGVLLLVKSTYTATVQTQIIPVGDKILCEDDKRFRVSVGWTST